MGATTFSIVTGTGAVLLPTGSSLARSPGGFVSTCGLGAGTLVVGTMTVYYNFTATSDNVTAIFFLAPAFRALASSFSILWLGLTPLPFVETASLANPITAFSAIAQPGFWIFSLQRILSTSDGDLKEVGYNDGNVSLAAASTPSFFFRMEYADAAAAYNGTFANGNGTFAYAGMSGNAVAVSFLPGRFLIDPQAVASSSSAGLAPYSIQRKVISYGSTYWVFFLNGNQIDYTYSVPSVTSSGSDWSAASAVPGSTSSYIMNGFTAVHFGSTVNVIWADGGSPDTKILMADGLISQGTGQPFITWRSTTPDVVLDVTRRKYDSAFGYSCPAPAYPTCAASIQNPVTAAYAPNGQLDFAYVVTVTYPSSATLADPILDREGCGDAYCSAPSDTLNEINLAEEASSGNDWPAGPFATGNTIGILVTPFNVATGTVAAVWTTTLGYVFEMTQWVNGTTNGLACINQLNNDAYEVRAFSLPSNFDPSSQLAASPTGSVVEYGVPTGPDVEVFLPTTGSNGNPLDAIILTQETLGTLDFLPWCNAAEDTVVENSYQNSMPNVEPYSLSASTESDGNSIDLFFAQGSGPYLTHMRVIPEQNAIVDKPGTAMLPWSGNYANPTDVSVMAVSSHYVFGAFDYYWANRQGSGYNLEAFEFPVPTDYNAGPNDPWVQLPGGPSMREQGSSVNPASGILTYGLPLVSTPVRGGSEQLSLAYMEPGLYYGNPSSPSIARDASPCDSAGFCSYGYFMKNSMFLDLPWIDLKANLLHLGTYTFDIVWDLPTATGVQWFNNTAGIRFNLKCCVNSYYILYLPYGDGIEFTNTGLVAKLSFDAAGNGLVFGYDSAGRLYNINPGHGFAPAFYVDGGPSVTISYMSPTSYQIQSIVYEGSKTIAFSYPTPTGVLVTDAVGRVTNFTFMSDGSGRLSSVGLSAGGRVNYTYLQSIQWGTGSDSGSLYTYPVSTETAYNESLTNKISRQLQFNYHFQNLDDIETDVRTADAGGVWQGETQYRFRSDEALTSVRTLDDSGQVLYYDMQTLNSGGAVSDLSGNRNSGTLYGSPPVTGGRYGTTYSLNSGSTWQYVAAGNAASLNPTSVTVAAWVSYRSLVNDQWTATILRKYDVNPNYGYLLDVMDLSTSCPRCLRLYIGGPGGNGGAYTSSATLPSANVWYFVAGVYQNATHTLALYINGALVDSVAEPSTFFLGASSQALGVGLNLQNSGHPASPFDGMIDEVRVYSRALSSDEIASLYNDNAIQVGMSNSWWSSNAQPHVVDAFNGWGTTTPSATSMDYVDDWGNVIYTRNAYGNESFASYANTNHQEEFYAPARLDKVGSGVLYQNSFDHGINDLTFSTQTGDASATMYYGNFGRYAPSMEISMSQSGSDLKLTRTFGASTLAPTAEFHVNFGDTSTNWLQFSFTSGGSTAWWVKFSGGSINAYGPPPQQSGCGSYTAGIWHTIVLQEYSSVLYLNVDRVQACELAVGVTVNGMSLEVSNSGTAGAYHVWLDDIRVISGCNGGYAVVCINGLQRGQIAELVDPGGTVLGTVEQSSTGTVNLYAPSSPAGSFNDVTIGDATILIFGVDGTLEYISPRTDFVAGDTYNYVPPRRSMGRLVPLRTGFDYFSSLAINEPGDLSSGSTQCWDESTFTQCSWASGGAGWSSFGFLPTPDLPPQSHTLGWSQSMMSEWVSGLTSGRGVQAIGSNNYLVNYVYLASSAVVPAQQSVGYAFGAEYASNSTFVVAAWGTNLVPQVGTPEPNSGNPLWRRSMGPITVGSAGFTVLKFIVKESDLFGTSTGNMNGYYFQTDGGRGGFFDGTSVGASDTGDVTVYGIPAATDNRVGVYWASNDTLIAQGTSTISTVVVQVYPALSVFPAEVKIKIDQCTSTSACLNNVWTPLYYSAPFTIWGGDQYNYMGENEFYDQDGGSVTWNRAIHDALLGQRTPAGDCTNAVLCYDMESIGASSDEQNTDGTARATTNDVPDLSGHGNHGSLQAGGGFQLASVSKSASGLGLQFDGKRTYISVPSSATDSFSQPITVSFWANWQAYPGVPSGCPYGSAVVLTKGSYTGAWWFEFYNGGGLTFWFTDSGGSSHGVSFGTQALGHLHHYVGTYDGTAMIAYEDGKKVAATSTLATMATTSNPIEIGYGGFTQSSCYGVYYANAALDQVLLYHVALTAQQVMGLYQARLPNAASTFYHINALGLPDRERQAVNGQFIERTFVYDPNGWGLPINSALNGNTTYYSYSKFDNGAFLTQMGRPDGANVFYSYDPFTGNQLGELAADCRRVRNTYDVADRLSQTAYYDGDPTTALYLDMETTSVTDTAQDWTFQDVSCNVAPSLITPGGTLGSVDAVYGPTGLSGMAQNFGGSSDIQVAKAFLANGGSASFSAWFRTTSDGVILGEQNAAVGGSATLYDPILYVETTGYLHAGVYTGSGVPNLVSSTTVNDGAWHYAVLVVSGGNTQTLYLDGVQVGSPWTASISVGSSYTTVGTGYAAGSWPNTNGAWFYLNGAVDEVRVFNAPLSQPSVQSLMAGTYKRMSSTAVAHDDSAFPSVTTYDGTSIPRALYLDMSATKTGQANALEDLSGNGNNSVMSGTSPATGVVGGARSFNGVSDSVQVSDSPSIDGMNRQLTVSFWANWTSFPANYSAIPITHTTPGGTNYIGPWWVELRPTGQLDFYLTVGGNHYQFTWTSSQSTGDWHHYAATWDGATVTLYIDGSVVKTGTLVGPLDGSTGPVAVGKGGWGSTYGRWYTNGILDEIQLLSVALTGSQVTALYDGYLNSGSPTKYPTSNTATATDCLGDASSVSGAWTNPSNAYASDGVYATASPGKGNLDCNEWNMFGLAVPAGTTVTSVKVTAAYYLSKASVTAHLHVGLLTSNGPTSCAVQQDASQPGSLTAVTFDFTPCKAWTPADFDTNAVKVDVGAHQVGGGQLTFYLDYVRIQVTYTAPGGFDLTHVSRTYFDGLGRPVRETTMDLYGNVLTTAQTMGWNDQPVVSSLATGQYSTSLYSYTGMPERVVAPAGLSTTIQLADYSSREVQTVDGDGHVSYQVVDLLGRTSQSGVLNPVGSTSNDTQTAYDALGLVTSQSVYSGSSLLQTTSYYYNAAGLLVYEIYPDGTSQTRTYDGDLRLASATDAMGHVATYAYVSTAGTPGDGMGWLASVQVRASAASTTCYETAYTDDVMGDPTEIDNGTAQVCGSGTFYYTSELITRTYDAMHRLQSEVTSAGTTLTYGYDNASRVTSVAYPGGQGTVYYAYDSLGRPSQVYWGGTASSDLYATAGYDGYGRLSTITYDQAGTSTGITQTYAYDAANRITEEKVASSSTGYMDLVYTYDAANLVTSISDNMYPGGASSPRTDTFRYDGNGRLVSASGPFSTKPLVNGDNAMGYVNDSYDALGNVLEKQDSDLGPCAQSCVRWDSGQTVTYAYGGPYDQLTSSSGKIAETFTYNGIGSMTGRSGSTYAVDLEQRLTGVTTSGGTWTYYKDGLGRTEEEVGPSYSVWYAYLGDGRLAYQDNQTSGVKSSFVYLGSQILFRKDSSSASAHFYATDLSNNVRLVWSYSSSVLVDLKQRYKPFGEAATSLNTPSTDPRFRYAEQSYSPPTKLYAMGARSYAPDLGRFTSRDPVGGHGYAYARDDPIAFWDPSGMDSQGINWAAVGAFLAGVAVVAGVIACGVVTGGACLGVAGALLLAGAAGAVTAGAVSAYEGQFSWGTVANGALMGVLGGGLVFGFAGAGVFGEAAANAAFDMSWGVPASLSAEEGFGAGAAGIADEEGAAEDLSAEPPPMTGAGATIAPPSQAAADGGSAAEFVDPMTGVPTNEWTLRQAGDEDFVWRVSGGKSPIEGSWWSRFRAESGIEARGVFDLPGGNAATRISFGQIQPGSYYWERTIVEGITEIYVPDPAFVTIFGTVRLPWV